MGKCTAPAETAVRWTPLPTAPRGPSCRARSPPSWELGQPVQDRAEQDPLRLRRLEPVQDPELQLHQALRVEQQQQQVEVGAEVGM